MCCPLDPDYPMPKCLQGSGAKMLFATSTPSNVRSPEQPEHQLLLRAWLHLFWSVLNSDRKRGSSEIVEAFRYAKTVSFFFYMVLVFWFSWNIHDRTGPDRLLRIKRTLSSPERILSAKLIKTCLLYEFGINYDLLWIDWFSDWLKPRECSRNDLVTGRLQCPARVSLFVGHVCLSLILKWRSILLSHITYHLFDSQIYCLVFMMSWFCAIYMESDLLNTNNIHSWSSSSCIKST